jgi:hypothetical protein
LLLGRRPMGIKGLTFFDVTVVIAFTVIARLDRAIQ